MKSIIALALAMSTSVLAPQPVDSDEVLDETIINEEDQTCESEAPEAEEVMSCDAMCCLNLQLQCILANCGFFGAKNTACVEACQQSLPPECQ